MLPFMMTLQFYKNGLKAPAYTAEGTIKDCEGAVSGKKFWSSPRSLGSSRPHVGLLLLRYRHYYASL